MSVHVNHDPHESWVIVQRAQAGDRAALGELYARYHDPVRRYIVSRVRDDVIADDLTADVFVRMLKNIGTYRYTGRDFGAWLVTIARNRVADHAKAYGTRMTFSVGEFHETVATDSSLEGRPEETTIAHLESDNLRLLMERLTAEQRRCVELRFLGELSVTETAAAMGKLEGAVKTLQYRAIASMARHFGYDVPRQRRSAPGHDSEDPS